MEAGKVDIPLLWNLVSKLKDEVSKKRDAWYR